MANEKLSHPAGVPPVAIIGMACRVAGADSPAELWGALCESKDAQSDIQRFSGDGFYRTDGAKRKGLTNVRRGYFINGDVDRFDNAFFGIPPAEASAMDPQQRMLLELTYEALENAGIPLGKFRGTNTGVYTGMTWNDYGMSLFRDVDATPKYMATGACNAMASNRVSYFFDLHGPSLVIDTACSSTMVALHQAVVALQHGEVEMAVVNGANLILNPDVFVCMSELGFLSPSGRCRTFDAAGDGYVRAEGVVALLLKPLDRAVADGDPVRAVIRGTRLNQDGRTQGITLPSPEAQRDNMEQLYKQIDLDPADVQYFEAHGTGTAAGDPLEMKAINAIYAPSRSPDSAKLVVGSIKSNVGHLETAAALAGLVKTVLALEHGQIPPQMHFSTPNPCIDFSNVLVPVTSVQNWPSVRKPGNPRRAALNSFGFGGTNGHAVLEEDLKYASVGIRKGPYLFKFSAATDAGLVAMADRMADYIVAKELELSESELSHTLLARRTTLKKVAFLVTESCEELVKCLREREFDIVSREETRQGGRGVAFVFTGQGGQWPTMGAELLATSHIFRATVARCNAALQDLPDGPDWDAATELCHPKGVSRVYKSRLSQPLCTILQIGLVELWKSWGLRPVAVVGHSSGEIGAAYAAGHLSLRDAVVVAYYRGLHLGREDGEAEVDAADRKGSMCALGLDEGAARRFLSRQKYSGRISLAAVNSPSSCTLSGDEDAINNVIEECKADGVFCRQLRVDMAYHSHHMLPMAPSYQASMQAAGVSAIPGADSCRMFSSVRGKEVNVDVGDCNAEYWTENMTSTVQFMAAVKSMLGTIPNLQAFVEIGPHPALKGPFQDTLAALDGSSCGSTLYFSSCVRGKPDMSALLRTVGEMITAGLEAALMLERVNNIEAVKGSQPRNRVLTDLPGYVWDHSVSHWAETRVSKNYRMRKHPAHELLGARKHTDNPIAMSWRSIISLSRVPWLRAWKKNTRSIPASAYLLMLAEAASQLGHEDFQAVELSGIEFHHEYSLSRFDLDDRIAELSLDFARKGTEPEFLFVLTAGSDSVSSADEWMRLCSGTLRLVRKMDDHLNQTDPLPIHDSHIERYAESFNLPELADVANIRIDRTCADGDIIFPADTTDNYLIPPLSLASVLTLPTFSFLRQGLPVAYCLRSIDRVHFRLPGAAGKDTLPMSFTASYSTPVNGVACATIRIRSCSPEGSQLAMQPCATLEGLRFESSGNVLVRTPPLESVFLSRKVLPDITYLEQGSFSSPISLREVIEMVTHKWPMADVGIAGVSARVVRNVVSLLPGPDRSQRPRFRSLTVLRGGNEVERGKWEVDRARILDAEQFEESETFDLLLIAEGWDRQAKVERHLRPDGILCVADSAGTTKDIQGNAFVDLGSAFGPDATSWALLSRPKQPDSGPPQADAASLNVIVSSSANRLEEMPDLSSLARSVRVIAVAEQNTAAADIRAHPAQHTIVLDLDESSLLVSPSSGHSLLPWVRALLKGHSLREDAGVLVWVSKQHLGKPQSAVAGAFIRTLRTEDPALVATSVVFENKCDFALASSVLARALVAARHGKLETEIIVRQDRVCAIRYLPDDELGAVIGAGMASPKTKEMSVGGNKRYRVSYMGETGLQLLAQPPPLGCLAQFGGGWGKGDVEVRVEASLVDWEDVSRLVSSRSQYAGSEMGGFFIGRISNEEGARVFGWATGAHASHVRVPTGSLIAIGTSHNGTNLSATLHRLGHFCAAVSILEGMGRIRPGDIVALEGLPTPLVAALENVMEAHKATTGKSDKADLVISYDPASGLSVNGRTAHLGELVSRRSLQCALSNKAYLLPQTNLKAFELPSFRDVFEHAAKHPGSAVLLHPQAEQAQRSVCVQVPAAVTETLFRPDGIYLIVGGLGGLGRHVCEWMASRGARNIATLSRRGASSPGVSSLTAGLARYGATLIVLSGDAKNSLNLRSALSDLRERKLGPIRGCIHMVMVLDDSPVASMTATQWEAPLQAKIASSWNLHEATLDDPLDMFILFSSVVSMTGNRTQASYAVGNAFLTRLAAERRAMGRTAVSVAVPAMRDIGVLQENEELLAYFDTAGLAIGGKSELAWLMEAAVRESHHASGREFIGMGLQMFATVDGLLQARSTQKQIFWADFAEFGCLMDHQRSNGGSASKVADSRSLGDRLRDQLGAGGDGYEMLLAGFMGCLVDVLGYKLETLDPSSPVSSYGLDSLNAVACRYWFFKEVGVDVPVFDVLGCKSIQGLVERVNEKLSPRSQDRAAAIPVPSKRPSDAPRLLSQSQQRLWFLQKFLTDKTAYNLLLVCHIDGVVQETLLEKAWQTLLDRHEVLHSCIVDTADGLQQIPVKGFSFALDIVHCDDEGYPQQMDALTRAARSHIFDLDKGELVRCWLLKGPDSTALFIGSHHLAWDRASTLVVFSELSTIYQLLAAGRKPDVDIKPVDFQFADYAHWQNLCLSSPAYRDPLLKYWTTQLAGIPHDAVSLLPLAHVDRRPSIQQHITATSSFTLPAALGRNIKTFCSNLGLTPFMFMTAALGAVISRLTGDSDILIGIADGDDRGHPAFDSLVGFTVNMLPLRLRIPSLDTLVLPLLESFRTTCLEAYAHRALPFDVLLQNLPDLPRSTAHAPVFQVMVNYHMQDLGFSPVSFGEFRFVRYDHYNARTQVDFALDVEESASGEMACCFEFDTALYSSGRMEELGKIYAAFVGHVVEARGELKLGDVDVISGEDRSLMRKLMTCQIPSGVGGEEKEEEVLFDVLFDKAVARFPNKLALVDDGIGLGEQLRVTYKQMDWITHGIAETLLKGGARNGDVVGLSCEPGAAMVLAMYGILRAGCAYVAVQGVPEERLRGIVGDVDVKIAVVDNEQARARLVGCGLDADKVHGIDALVRISHGGRDTVLKRLNARKLQPNDPISCFFTSGSTGKPKGVIQRHGGVRMWYLGCHSKIPYGPDDTLLLASASTFDVSLMSIFGVIACGSTLVVASREALYSGSGMANILANHKITTTFMTPTQLSAILSSIRGPTPPDWQNLRHMVVAGESVPHRVVRDFHRLGLKGAGLWNAYGPSEATITVAIRRLDIDDDNSPLDSPQYPASFDILDQRGNQVPFGVPGELYISGPGVVAGYIKRPELSAVSFLPDTISGSVEGRPLMYRTGDRFHLDREGTLVIRGRVGGDRQVKIRGMRTELGDVESAVMKALDSTAVALDRNSVEGAAAVYRKDEDILVMYLAVGLEEGASEPHARHQNIVQQLRRSLQATLPVHMRPGVYSFLEKLPTTSSGKTDYRTLSALPLPTVDSNTGQPGPSPGSELTEIQAEILGIWRRTLTVELGPLSQSDDFFSVGGHSLALLQVQQVIIELFGVRVPLADMFADPSLRGMEKLVIHRLTDTHHGSVSNQGPGIDWEEEAKIPADLDSGQGSTSAIPPTPQALTAVILTGGSSTPGSHILHQILTRTKLDVYCLAEMGPNASTALQGITDAFQTHGLVADTSRIHAFPGTLTHPTLGLSAADIEMISGKTQAIFHLASDVTLFGNADRVRAGNLGSLHFLLSLALGSNGPPKAFHYLSSWGVPHLQSWHDTVHVHTTAAKTPIRDERSMSHIRPGSSSRLAYLKARWACEALLESVAPSLPAVNIFRASMCVGRGGLPRTDINRRILRGMMETGCVPDFEGGMSWIMGDYLAEAVVHLAMRSGDDGDEGTTTRVWHVVPGRGGHHPYCKMVDVLGKGYDGRPLRLVQPKEWFDALRALDRPELSLHAAVLEEWWSAGWAPFELAAAKTLDVLEKEAGIRPSEVDREMLLLAAGEREG
ncbi:Nonribosomal peptide synthetase-like protein [Podospora aff. communis PSN243]|uniref:Nonribosomal peptide synthetase-like protein n=1 Tax=Podospora aff. communis PSN243 TaxID=3040156 RepID=A0AAV9GMF1_9PEZI|nr:Nonribosomal peptide synthetase-like protein [Podospora aff. communis PSN243]